MGKLADKHAERVDAADQPPPAGHNQPPEDTPWEAIRAHLDDTLMEARNWADGSKVETQAQADEINRLIDDLRAGEAAAEAQRVKEKAPFDEKIAEIQDRFNVYIAPLKNKKPGKIPQAISALKAALTPFLQAQEDAKRAAAEAARKEAEAKAAAAAEAVRQAQASDLTARESAEDLLAEAEAAQAAAKRAERDKAQAHGGVRATGLRSFWTVQVADSRTALLHYINTNRQAFDRLVEDLARADVAAGKRQIPGCEVTEERRVA